MAVSQPWPRRVGGKLSPRASSIDNWLKYFHTYDALSSDTFSIVQTYVSSYNLNYFTGTEILQALTISFEIVTAFK